MKYLKILFVLVLFIIWTACSSIGVLSDIRLSESDVIERDTYWRSTGVAFSSYKGIAETDAKLNAERRLNDYLGYFGNNMWVKGGEIIVSRIKKRDNGYKAVVIMIFSKKENPRIVKI